MVNVFCLKCIRWKPIWLGDGDNVGVCENGERAQKGLRVNKNNDYFSGGGVSKEQRQLVKTMVKSMGIRYQKKKVWYN